MSHRGICIGGPKAGQFLEIAAPYFECVVTPPGQGRFGPPGANLPAREATFTRFLYKHVGFYDQEFWAPADEAAKDDFPAWLLNELMGSYRPAVIVR